MNNEEQREYKERMGGPDMEYLQYKFENPEINAMPNENSTMESRFRQSFGNYWSKIPQGNAIGFVDLDDKRPIVLDIESVIAFIQDEIDRAVGEERERIVSALNENGFVAHVVDDSLHIITKQS